MRSNTPEEGAPKKRGAGANEFTNITSSSARVVGMQNGEDEYRSIHGCKRASSLPPVQPVYLPETANGCIASHRHTTAAPACLPWAVSIGRLRPRCGGESMRLTECALGTGI